MSNNYKPDEICSALRLFFKPGDVFEVRALNATTAGYRREHPESGYFDHEHINDIPKTLQNISGRGVYFTPNPVNPTLLARAANRMKPAAKDSSTSDGDIVSRRWFLIDCDPIRAAGISTTDEEHNLAIEKAKEVRAGLKSMDWPDPILLDSGNGSQLMYRVDLPTGDNGLIQSCLKALASASDVRVQIDQTVHNPARIWRLPGTKNRKGDEIAGRMHRMAKILEIPEKIEIVPEEKLRALIRQKEVAAPITAPTNTIFNLNDWISKYCPDAKGPEQWKDGRKWVFPVCPFNSAHDNSSAVITQQAGGAIGFKCHHNGCIKNDWHALRRLREPETIPATFPDVDISGITRQIKAQSKIPKEDIAKDPGPMPEELLHVPGFIDEVMNYTLRTAPYPNKILAFAGALSLQAFLAGRKIMDNIRNLTNIYLIALADSGTGKEHPRLVNREIVIAAGLAGKIGDAFASGEGIEDIMYINHAMLFQTDEIDSLLMSVGNIKDVRIANIVAVLLKMFSASASTYDLRIKAGDKCPRFISKPSLTLFGTAVPEYFYGALNPKMFQDGLMARSIVMEACERGDGQDPDYEPLPESIIQTARWWAEFHPGRSENARNNISEINSSLKPLPLDPAAKKRSFEIMKLAEEEYKKCKKLRDPIGQTEWTRVFHNARRLALIYAVSKDKENPELSVEALEWGWRFMKYHTEQMIFKAHTRVSENPFHGECQKLLERLRQAPEQQLPHSVLLKRMKINSKEFKEMVDTLVQQGDIDKIMKETEGRIGCFYKLTGV